jgi:beta-galactosidase
VELLVNGQSLGVRKNSPEVKNRNVIYWKNVPFAPGTITAIARTGGKEVARHELETTGTPVALEIETENPAWKANGMDLQYVKVYAVDSNGRRVQTAADEITVEVSGAARLIALDNGDHASDRLFGGNKTTLYKGFAMAILRAETTGGTVDLKVTAAGMQPVEKTLIVK